VLDFVHTFAAMEEKLEKIIADATALFMKYGVKSVNMDDVARHLGMSKKTLYKYVSDKEDLVRRAMNHHCEVEDKAIQAIHAQDLNAIDEAFEVMRMVINMIKDLNPSVAYDITKYHPELMREMECNRHGMVFQTMKSNMEKGIKEGFYRDDLDTDIIANLYVSSINAIFTQFITQEGAHPFHVIYLEMFRYHIRGIASEKGIKYLIEKVKIEKYANTNQIK
jgi:TetR/AcrR family transcriptional regulator, cholesterol catabolism regulator